MLKDLKVLLVELVLRVLKEPWDFKELKVLKDYLVDLEHKELRVLKVFKDHWDLKVCLGELVVKEHKVLKEHLEIRVFKDLQTLQLQ